MILLETIGFACLAVVTCIAVIALLAIWQYVWRLCNRKCKRCGKKMQYRGLREYPDEGYYLFHCTHCGNWEQVPREEFLRECE